MTVHIISWLPDAIATVASICTALLSTQYDFRSASRRTSARGVGFSDGIKVYTLAYGGCMKHCRDWRTAPSPKIFWTLQKEVVRGFQNILRLERDSVRIPETLVNPSPLFVFAGWMLVALTLSIASEVSNGRRNHIIFLSSGILVGLMLGLAECASLRSVLLTNLPWSVAIALACSTVFPRRKTVQRCPRGEKD